MKAVRSLVRVETLLVAAGLVSASISLRMGPDALHVGVASCLALWTNALILSATGAGR